MRRSALCVVLSLAVIAIGHSVFAQTFSVQGVLRDPLGKTVADGNYRLTFRLYEQATGGTAVWQETQGSVDVLHGVFSPELGTVNSLSAAPFNKTYWLGISINDGAEVAPRFKLTKSPAAMSVLGTDNVFPSRGNVGVGTASPTAELHIKGTTGVTDELLIEDPDGANHLLVTSNNSVGVGVETPAAALHIKTANDSQSKLLIEGANGDDYVVVTGAGKMGVGVSAPTDPLSINGNLRLTNGGAIVFDDGTSIPSAKYGGAATAVASPGNALITADAGKLGSGQVQFVTGEVTQMVVANDGKVGIGTTTPSSALSVNGAADFTGKVGIGTTAPSYELDVSGAIRATGAIYAGPDGKYFQGGNDASLNDINISNTIGVYGEQDPTVGSIKLGSGGGTISGQNGNIGIGTTTPDPMAKLHVMGSENVGGTDVISDVFDRPTVQIEGVFPNLILKGSGNASHTSTVGIWGFDGTNTNQWNMGVSGTGLFSMGYAKNKENPHSSVNNFDGTSTLAMTPSGNVGIGTTAPDSRLNVTGGYLNAPGGFAVADGDPAVKTNRGLRITRGSQVDVWAPGYDAINFAPNSQLLSGNSWEHLRIERQNDKVGLYMTGSEYVMGNVGIGTTSPTEKLHVNGTVRATLFRDDDADFYADLNGGANLRGEWRFNGNIFANNIYASNINSWSDRRMKHVHGVSNSREDVETLKKLEVTNYSYVDVIGNGDSEHKKLIAQQVQEVYPQAVSETVGFIPNVYEQSVSASYDSAHKQLAVTTRKAHEFTIGDTVRIAHGTTQNGKSSESFEVTSVVDEHTFTIRSDSGYDSVFVWGKKVDDLLTLDYDAISMLNVSATQELARQVEALQSSNASLQATNEALQAKIGEFEAALQRLEAKAASGEGTHRAEGNAKQIEGTSAALEN